MKRRARGGSTGDPVLSRRSTGSSLPAIATARRTDDFAGSAAAQSLVEGFSSSLEQQMVGMVQALTVGLDAEQRGAVLAAMAQRAHAAVDRVAKKR